MDSDAPIQVGDDNIGLRVDDGVRDGGFHKLDE